MASLAEPDYATKLNNVLQGHPSGNLTPHFQYVMAFKPGGPDLQMAHHATAKFRGIVLGRGKGFSKGAAKRDAARAALQYIHRYGLPGSDPIEGDSSDAVLDLQRYLHGHPGGSLITSFPWSVPQAGLGGLDKTHHATARFDGSRIGRGEGFPVYHAQ